MVGIEYYALTSRGYVHIPPVDAVALSIRESEYEINCRPVRNAKKPVVGNKVR